jgi:hypothetical protein
VLTPDLVTAKLPIAKSRPESTLCLRH